MKWLLRHSMYITLNILYIYFHYAAYKYASCNARENVADLIYVAKPDTHALLRATFTHYICVYVLCNLHNGNVYSVVYIYGVIYERATTFVCITNSECLHVTVKCVYTTSWTVRINFYKLEYPNVLKRWNVNFLHIHNFYSSEVKGLIFI